MSRQAELIRRVFDHTYTKDTYAEVRDLYHPDLVYHPRSDDPEPGVHIGREAFMELIAGYVEALSEIRFSVLEVIEAGDRVIASTILHGSGSTSGAPVSDPYVFVYEVRDGVVVEGWEFKTIDEARELVADTGS